MAAQQADPLTPAPVHLAAQAAYVRVPPPARRACAAAGLAFRKGVHGAAHALLNVLPRFMMCNAGDVGGALGACCRGLLVWQHGGRGWLEPRPGPALPARCLRLVPG
jgi:hypothetical protein